MWLLFVTAFVLTVSLGACNTERRPATPLETFKTYTRAIKQKDTKTMKLLLSRETIGMHEQEAKAQNVTLDEIVTRETLFAPDQKTVEYRNETVDGRQASLEVKNSYGMWETVPFVFEDDQWKIDKKGYADRLMHEIEQQNKQLQERIEQGRQPDSLTVP